MLKSKALDILESLTTEEVKDFRIFLSSPYFNTNKTIIKFYDILIKFYPKFNQPALTKEHVYAKLHPDSKYKDEVIRNLLSRLLLLGEEFLSLRGLELDENRKSVYLIGELSKRNLGSLFEKNVKRLEKALPNIDTDGNSYLIKFELETEKFNFNMSNKKISSPLDIEDDMNILIKRGENLINFFLFTHIKEIDLLRKFEKIYNFDAKDTMTSDFSQRVKLTELLEYFIKRKDENSVIYEIYYNLIKAFEEITEDKYYKNLKKLLVANVKILSKDEKHFLFGKLLDYGIIKNRQDEKSNFEEEHFENHKMYLENEYYLHSKNQYLMLDLFRNILILSLRRKDFNWAEKFINNYIRKLKEDYQENTYHYAMAFLYYQKGDLEKALVEINQVAYDNFAYKYDVRNLNLMICYELGKWETVKSIIESYKRFLLNNKNVGADRKEFFGNFLKYISKLVKLKDDVNKPEKLEKDYLRRQIIKTNRFSYKDWVLEKVDEL